MIKMEPTPEENIDKVQERIDIYYTDLTEVRTDLETEIREGLRYPNRYIQSAFFTAFVGLFDMSWLRMDTKKHAKLIEQIRAWDNDIEFKVENPLLGVGIQLSEELQKVLREDGIYKGDE